MSDSPASPQWIDVSQVDDLRDVVHRAVACLAQGGVVGLATETVYGLAACALWADAVARVRALRRSEPSRPLTLLLKGPDEVTDWVPRISQVGRRMAWRLWPGPATLVFSRDTSDGLFSRLPEQVKSLVSPDGALALRSPAQPIIRDVLRLLPAPLVISMVATPERPIPSTAEALRGLAGLDMVVDAGPTHYQKLATVVKIDEDRWSIEREGVIDAATLAETSCLIILFVCTGNTCRSPMAEAICKVLLARRLHCPIDQLEQRGFVVRSAGVAAATGDPAASHAIDIVRTMGGSLENHRSRKIAAGSARQADFIFAMTIDHLDDLLRAVPEVEPRAFLLDPAGGDVADPVGCGHETYLRTAQMIESMMEQRLDEIGL
ncbi:MAG: Sua5/YciO/YrdC/YwlC family protein [Isosphaerales bacterium]